MVVDDVVASLRCRTQQEAEPASCPTPNRSKLEAAVAAAALAAKGQWAAAPNTFRFCERVKSVAAPPHTSPPAEKVSPPAPATASAAAAPPATTSAAPPATASAAAAPPETSQPPQLDRPGRQQKNAALGFCFLTRQQTASVGWRHQVPAAWNPREEVGN